MIDLRYLTSGVCLPVCLPVTYRSLLPLHLNSKKLVVALSIILRMITHRIVGVTVSLLHSHLITKFRIPLLSRTLPHTLNRYTGGVEVRCKLQRVASRRLRVELVKWGHYYWSSAPPSEHGRHLTYFGEPPPVNNK